MASSHSDTEILKANTALTQTHMGSAVSLLRNILSELRSGVLEIAVGDQSQQELVLTQFPVTGARRTIAYRTGSGFDTFEVPAQTTPLSPATPLLPANEGRLGGEIRNYGSAVCYLYLTERNVVPGSATGVPCIFLGTPSDGPGAISWDFRLGNVVWTGGVSVSVLGSTATTLSVAEV